MTMDETTGTPALNKALAAVQAALPPVGKGETGEVKGVSKDTGKPFSYTYKYANLADVSAAILPLLGQNGLSFTAKPTLNGEGKFVLAYSLKHESGEHDDGEFPLLGANSPQQVGSLITYARRYCLCSVTGIAPDSDDDGAAAEHGSREEDWRTLPPVNRPRRDSGNGQGAPPVQPARQADGPQVPARPAAADDELLGSWAAKIDEITSTEDAGPILEELDAAHSGGTLDSRRHKVIKGAVEAKVATLNGGRRPHPPAGPPAEERGAQPVATGKGDNGEWVTGFLGRLASVKAAEGLDGFQGQISAAVRIKTISPAKAAELSAAIRDRRNKLQEVTA